MKIDRWMIGFTLAVGALGVAGCRNEASNETAPQAVTPASLHATMKQVVAPQAQILWDVSNRAVDEQGKPDPSKLSGAEWSQIAAAGGKVEAVAKGLAAAATITVAAPGEKIQDEGTQGGSTAAQVKGFIAADRPGFNAFSEALAADAREFVEAAKAKDGAKLAQVSGELDEVCESCHVKYWYPQQAAPQ